MWTRSTRRISRAVRAHRREHGLGVERPADALVEGGEGAGLLVVEPLGLEVPGALDGEAELAAHRLEEAQLVVRRTPRRAGRPRSGRRGSPRRSASGTQAWATGWSRPAAIVGMRGHSVVLRACMPWPEREDLPAEALAEAPRPRRSR